MRVAILMAAFAVAAGTPLRSQDDESRTLRHRLNTIRLDVDFKDASLEDVVDYLREVAGINIVLNPKARIAGTLTMKAKGVTLASVLRLLLNPHRIGTAIEAGVLIIAPEETLASAVRLEIVDVRDLLLPIRDFPGGDITLSGDAAGTIFTPPPEEPPAEFPIVDLVKAHTGAKSWDENPRASIQLMNGLLFVRQTSDVIAQVKRVLASLRRFK